MSSPFQQAFSAKRQKLMQMPVSELKPQSIVKNPVVSDESFMPDFNTEGSLSSNPKPMELTPASTGGGTDYEAQIAASEAVNPEGQGDEDYEVRPDAPTMQNYPVKKKLKQ
tara:strand:- start:689 stop:1021 length:333 start_codon:yes stop_codon:yes gene_type:complete